ncbi:hypothetical protein N9W34_00110 [Rickettsiales bacterium]|nr:hypothetical protein [Rickettsiales bacterium]
MKKLLLASGTIILGMTLQGNLAKAEPVEDVIIKEYFVSYYAEPNDYFYQARLDYLYSYNKAAADEIRRGARFLANEAEKVTGNSRKDILESYDNLNDMATSIENGEYYTIADMDYTFAEALIRLAHEQNMFARYYWKENKKIFAGEALLASANNIRHAYSWVQEKIGKDDYNNLNVIRDNARKMTKGEKADVKSSFDILDGLIRKFKKRLVTLQEQINSVE